MVFLWIIVKYAIFIIKFLDIILKEFFIYILYSEKSQIYYVGYTSDIKKRIIQHNDLSENSFTSKHRPWILKALFEVNGTEADAMQIENFIKKQKSSKFIERIIATETPFFGVLAQLIRVPKLRD